MSRRARWNAPRAKVGARHHLTVIGIVIVGALSCERVAPSDPGAQAAPPEAQAAPPPKAQAALATALVPPGDLSLSTRGAPDERPASYERVRFEPLFDPGAHLTAHKPVRLRFRMEDLKSTKPISPFEISVLVLQDPSGYRFRGAPSRGSDGVYEVTFTPPSPGRYRLLVGAASRGAKLGIVPFLMLHATRSEDVSGEEAPAAREALTEQIVHLAQIGEGRLRTP